MTSSSRTNSPNIKRKTLHWVVKSPTYTNLKSSSEEHHHEKTPSPPSRKKSLSPPHAPSKSASSRSTYYTSSSSPRHRFSPNKSSVVHEKTSPRSCLRWKSTGKIFKTVGLRWTPIGKLFASSTTKVDSEPPHGYNAHITNPHECIQTLDISAWDPQLIKKCVVAYVDNTSGSAPQQSITSDNFISGLRLHSMASINNTLGPAPQQSMTYDHFRSGLVLHSMDAKQFKRLGYLVSSIVDEYFLPPLSVVSLVLLATVLIPADTTGTPSSTTLDQDAPFASTSLTTEETQALVIHQGVGE
ncbi:hypothetical protein Tco_0848561 [Tanacetum coccineum]